jgi:hypothetical protein
VGRFDAETRASLGLRLIRMYRSLGWSRAACAKFLHVCERTLHNWESGRHDIPYAAFRLLRIECGYELPGAAWAGWRLSGGKLYTPEGFAFRPEDASWWSLLVRRAETGSKALRILHAMKRDGGLEAVGGEAARARCAGAGDARLDLTNGHIRTSSTAHPVQCGIAPESPGSGQSLLSSVAWLGIALPPAFCQKAKAPHCSHGAGPSVHNLLKEEASHGMHRA